jgi:hypothetical protein
MIFNDFLEPSAAHFRTCGIAHYTKMVPLLQRKMLVVEAMERSATILP